MQKIIIIGAGYVGLVTGACFAQKKNSVVIVEKNKNKIATLLNGEIPFYEPQLIDLIKQAIANQTITFTNNIVDALSNNNSIIFSCVNTPQADDGSADLSAVFAVAKEIGKYTSNDFLFINKSTVPVGTADKVKEIIKLELATRKKTLNFEVVSNPEFLKEGSAVQDFLYPDRIIIGTKSKHAIAILYKLYKPFIQNKDQFISIDTISAELTKYAANAMLAMRISFMNQLSQLAHKVGANIDLVKEGISKDKRIGKHFLNAGIGYGGSCFSKDVNALVATGKQHQLTMPLIKEIENTNESHKKWFAQQIINFYGHNLANKTIGIWGLSFKPNTDDMRHAPSIIIIKQLLANKARILAYDPAANKNAQSVFGNTVSFAKNACEILQFADCLLLLTEWKEFLNYPPELFLKLKDKTVFDGRNYLQAKSMTAIGINYFSVGKTPILQPYHTENIINESMIQQKDQ